MIVTGQTYDINRGFGSPEKGLVLILLKRIQNFAWIYIIMQIIVMCLLIQKKYLIFKAHNRNINLPARFCLGSISDGFSAREV